MKGQAWGCHLNMQRLITCLDLWIGAIGTVIKVDTVVESSSDGQQGGCLWSAGRNEATHLTYIDT